MSAAELSAQLARQASSSILYLFSGNTATLSSAQNNVRTLNFLIFPLPHGQFRNESYSSSFSVSVCPVVKGAEMERKLIALLRLRGLAQSIRPSVGPSVRHGPVMDSVRFSFLGMPLPWLPRRAVDLRGHESRGGR